MGEPSFEDSLCFSRDVCRRVALNFGSRYTHLTLYQRLRTEVREGSIQGNSSDADLFRHTIVFETNHIGQSGWGDRRADTANSGLPGGANQDLERPMRR